MLTSERLQFFINDLTMCSNISSFDQTLLKNLPETIASLTSFSKNDWLTLYQKRFRALLSSEFDATRSVRTVNRIWWDLAIEIVEASDDQMLLVTDVYFPGIKIRSADQLWISDLTSIVLFYFNDANNHLISIQQMLHYLSSNGLKQFSSYNVDGTPYALTLYEANQLRNKTDLYYDPDTDSIVNLKIMYAHAQLSGVMLSLEQFIDNKKLLWKYILSDLMVLPTEKHFFKSHDLLYPLFSIVQEYFKTVQSNDHATHPFNGLVFSDKINALYVDELAHLSILDVNAFYEHKIVLKSKKFSSFSIIDILLDALKVERPKDLFSKMVALASWISEKNPSMLIQNPIMASIYKKSCIGEFCTRDQLRFEIEQLTYHRSEISNEESHVIQDLVAVLSDISLSNRFVFTDKIIFEKINSLFILSDHRVQSRTFTSYRTGAQLVVGSYEFVYYQQGVNAQYIRIAQLLSGWGYSQHHGKADPYLWLIPTLEVCTDLLTGEPLSNYPLSHYSMPRERTYLVSLDFSVLNFKSTGWFLNANAIQKRPFSEDEYYFIQLYSAPKFRSALYKRLPEGKVYPLKASTLLQLVNLVNYSFNYGGLSEAYRILEVDIFPTDCAPNIIYIRKYSLSVEYAVRDLWDLAFVHYDQIDIDSPLSRRLFLEDQFSYVMKVTASRNHTRPNIARMQYYKTCIAYMRFREFYSNSINPQAQFEEPIAGIALDLVERENLDNSMIRFSGNVRTFKEVFADGSPDCMSMATKWISILITDCVPEILFAAHIENHRQSGYLAEARRSSRRVPIINDLVQFDPAAADLAEYLTHSTSKPTVVSTVLKYLSLFGIYTQNQVYIDFDELALMSMSDKQRAFTPPIASAHKKSEPVSSFIDVDAQTDEEYESSSSSMKEASFFHTSRRSSTGSEHTEMDLGELIALENVELDDREKEPTNIF